MEGNIQACILIIFNTGKMNVAFVSLKQMKLLLLITELSQIQNEPVPLCHRCIIEDYGNYKYISEAHWRFTLTLSCVDLLVYLEANLN